MRACYPPPEYKCSSFKFEFKLYPRYEGQYARSLCGRLFSSRVIGIPVIVTMVAGPSKFKAPAHCKCQCHLSCNG